MPLEWAGGLATLLLVVGCGGLAFWLYTGPTPATAQPPAFAPSRLALLVLASAIALVAGARWDEIWHRTYGGFGDDFLWPPHLLIYAGLAANLGFAVLGLARLSRLAGGWRSRFQAQPLVGLLALISAYQVASIPSDFVWHRVIGPDLTAWSLPHVLLALTISAVWLTGVVLAVAAGRRTGELATRRPAPMEITALALLTASLLALLQIGVTEWEWLDGNVENLSAVLARPLWAYPVVVLVVGVAHAQLAVCITRLLGAATVVAVAALAIQIVFIALARSALPPGPMLASHALIVPPALALDLSYFLTRRQAARGWPAWAVGSIAYTLVFCTPAFPAIEVLLPFPSLEATSRLETLVMGLVGALVAGAGAEWTGNAAAFARAHADRRVPQAAKVG